MKYIKSINELNKNEYYEELSEDDFNSNSKVMEEDWLSKSEFKKITSLVEELNPIEYEVKYAILKDNTGLKFRWLIDGVDTLTGHKPIEIKKYEDNWFLVDIAYYNLYMRDMKVIDSDKKCVRYFKCDQLEAVFKLLREEIPNIFNKVEAPQATKKKNWLSIFNSDSSVAGPK
jgi:hypothetical protein